MSFLYSTCSTPRSMSQLSVTPLDEKMSELDKLKREVIIYMKKVNRLKLEYVDWWDNRHSTFLNSVLKIQRINRHMCPQTITCMADFHKLYEMAHLYKNAGKIDPLLIKMEQIERYKEFWDRFTTIKTEGDEKVVDVLNEFCFTITRLRDPRVKIQIDDLQEEITTKSDDKFDFTALHNTKENLFAYKVGVGEKDMLGFIGFMPHLANLQRKLCYLVTKLHVEKE